LHNDPLHSDDAAKTYQKYFLVYSFLGVVIGAYDLQEVGWIILGISAFLIVIA
jgi:hypothetical protein